MREEVVDDDDRQREQRQCGLNPDHLASRLHRTGRHEARSLGHLARHVGDRDAWVAWSGGKDSTCAAHLAHTWRPGIPVVHFDSGLDFPENTAYMAEIARERGWNYQPVRVGDGLAEMVANGSWDWTAELAESDYWWVVMLGPSAEACAMYGRHIIWGLRADESTGRRWNLAPRDGVRRKVDGTTTVAPLWWWTRADTFAHLARHGIPRNPLYDRMAELGVPEQDQRVDIAVGSNGADRGRISWLRRGWPALYARYEQALPRLREMA